MKRVLTYALSMTLLLAAVGRLASAQNIEYPSAKDAVKSVLWDMMKDKAKIDPGTSMLLSAMEILTIDSQAYGDVAKGLYWVDEGNRTQESNWGDMVVQAPRGSELRDTLVEFKEAGALTEQEIEQVRNVVQAIPRESLRITDFPQSVQNKVNATLKVALNPKKDAIIKSAVDKATQQEVKNNNLRFVDNTQTLVGTGACDQYAKAAVQSNEENLRRGCGCTGLRWQSDYAPHYNWCVTVDNAAAQSEARIRADDLRKCSGATGKNAACDQYAKAAVQSNEENLRRGCGYTGLRWQSDYAPHYNWCVNVDNAAAQSEARIRADDLLRCLHP